MNEKAINFDDYEEVLLVNESGLPDADIKKAIAQQVPELARINSWADSFTGKSRSGGLFSQDRFVAPQAMFDKFRTAADAVKVDDVVANAVETTEQLAFKRVIIETGDDDETNIANQIIDNINLPKIMRSIWRELFTISQCYLAVIWERKDLKVKGITTNGTKKKKVYKQVLVPKGITILDPLKVIPVGNFMFGQERLVYIANVSEAENIYKTLAGANSSDLIVNSLFDGPYQPDYEELLDISRITGEYNLQGRMFYLKQENCWRITSSRPDYQRFADVRMESVFELLDLKHNLRESDRSDILGNLNCIILVRKGSDKFPAQEQELAGAAMQMRQGAKIPLIVSDHRMEIDIITKKTDNVLRPERYNILNAAITARLYQILNSGSANGAGERTDNSAVLFKIIASGMEARRDDIRNSIMEKVIEVTWEKNSDKFKSTPEMNFYPRRISLDFDPHYAQIIFDLFSLGNVSRETMLSELDISQDQEAAKKLRENNLYGDIFTNSSPTTTMTPEQKVQQKVAGRIQGGNNNGGGTNQTSFNPSPNNVSSNQIQLLPLNKAETEGDDL